MFGLGWGSLASWDEALYAQVAKEIARTGEWVHLKFMGEDWYCKPPISIWATACFYKIFGVNEFATRLFSGLMGALAVPALYRLAREFLGRHASFIAAASLLTTAEYLHYARFAITDVPNVFFFIAAVACFAKGRRDPRWFLAFGAALAGGFMTKGPVIAFAGIILFLWSAWEKDLSFLKKKMFWLGLVLAAALALPWHAAAYLHSPEQFMRDFIGLHWFARAQTALDGHSEGWYFYIRTLVNKYHPWIVVLPFALLHSARKAFRGGPGSSGHRLALVWAIFIFGFFTFGSETKLRWYILPAFPAFSLSIGGFIAELFKGKKAVLLKPAVVVTLVVLAQLKFFSVFYRDYSPGIKIVAPAVTERLAPGESVYFYRFHEDPAGTFYTDRRVQYIESVEELDRLTAGGKKVLLLVPEEAFRDDGKAILSRGFSIIRDTSGLKENVVLLLKAE